MKTAKYAVMYVTALFLAGNALALAEENKDKLSQRPYVGVRLDPNPLPKLLTKHLKLEEGQGLLVYNVQVDSPADKVGIERDDIIIGFAGKQVTGYDDFVSDIRKEGVGTEVELEIIHEGDRIVKKLTLAPFEKTDKWKYPFRQVPKVQRTPDRIFRMEPGDQQWQQIPFEGLPKNIYPFFQQKRSYHINNLKIDIDGDPKHPDTKIAVHDTDTGKRFRTTVGKIDELPKKYRDIVRGSLNPSLQKDGTLHFEFPPNLRKFDDDPLIVPDPYHGRDIEKYFDELRRETEEKNKDSLRDLNQRLEKMEKDNRRLQEQMEKMLKQKHSEEKEQKDDSDAL